MSSEQETPNDRLASAARAEHDRALHTGSERLLVKIAELFRAHPRLKSLGYTKSTIAGAFPLIGLVEIPSPEDDGEYPQFDRIEREDAGEEWMDILVCADETALRAVFGGDGRHEVSITRSQACGRVGVLMRRAAAQGRPR